MALAYYKIPYFSKKKKDLTPAGDPASSEVQALSISPLAGEQRARAERSDHRAARRGQRRDPIRHVWNIEAVQCSNRDRCDTDRLRCAGDHINRLEHDRSAGQSQTPAVLTGRLGLGTANKVGWTEIQIVGGIKEPARQRGLVNDRKTHLKRSVAGLRIRLHATRRTDTVGRVHTAGRYR